MCYHSKIEVREFNAADGRVPFREWFESLNSTGAQKVATALNRLRLGNFSNVKSVGAGVYECKINFGPGYRVYFGQESDRIVILLGGGTKQRQQTDITIALRRWADYKQRKKVQGAKE
jgi:putative addiction module killer protein